jgi:hypothetical protein
VDLPENQTDAWSDVVIRGGYVLQPGTTQPFRSDLAFNYLHNGRQAVTHSGQTRVPSQIFLMGDASRHAAGTSVNANGKILLPAFEAGLQGWSEKSWLDKENLTGLAQMGVGTIYWAVSEADHVAATLYADSFAVQGLPRIEVLTNPLVFPGLILSGSPTRPASMSTLNVLHALGVDVLPGNGLSESLWVESTAANSSTARLCKDRPASFLMVSSPGDGQLDWNTGQLLSVWLDGYQVDLY